MRALTRYICFSRRESILCFQCFVSRQFHDMPMQQRFLLLRNIASGWSLAEKVPDVQLNSAGLKTIKETNENLEIE